MHIRPPENPIEDRIISALDRQSSQIKLVALNLHEARVAASALRQIADMIEKKSPEGAMERRNIALTFEGLRA